MSEARRCDMCGVLFERRPGDLVLVELAESCEPPKGHKDGDWTSTLIDEDDPADFCSACSVVVRDFLKPVLEKVESESAPPEVEPS